VQEEVSCTANEENIVSGLTCLLLVKELKKYACLAKKESCN